MSDKITFEGIGGWMEKSCPCLQCAYTFSKDHSQACPHLVKLGEPCSARLSWQKWESWTNMILREMLGFKQSIKQTCGKTTNNITGDKA